MKFSSNQQHGATLFEIVIVIVLMVIIFQISITAFYSLTKQQSLDKDVESAYSLILKARNQTINGEGNSVYGVHFASTSVSLFKGSTYSIASTTSLYTLNNKSYLDSVSLTGGVTDVTFQKISGSPSATGTAIYKITSDSTVKKTILINGSGLVEVQ